ncbi:hypothetical protein KGA66_24840 [Actinocrinis puniceicyclus]|uniref:Uncharacterized protein n=1 Tax=Actinocrinis puniceicyclus TaxID=977794 RepID=A0A8J7WPT3_9ACTN|nr:DUF5999 family protein [Actinocrinis puniceicyclus]MBS2966296.1 hypothetical protein [Actinocrinis puniceicyclus]
MPATTSGAARSDALAPRAATGSSTTETAATSAGPAHCRHSPACPPSGAADRYRAHVIASHPEQGWSLLCNGVIVFDDLGAVLPGSELIPAVLR